MALRQKAPPAAGGGFGLCRGLGDWRVARVGLGGVYVLTGLCSALDAEPRAAIADSYCVDVPGSASSAEHGSLNPPRSGGGGAL